MNTKSDILVKCQKLLLAYQKGELGYMKMPEDESPQFSSTEAELRLVYFTLPMALNYQRNSYALWESVKKSYEDTEIQKIFDIAYCANISQEELRSQLLEYKIALQPNKHVQTWHTIAKTIWENWQTMENMFAFFEYDFLRLQKALQKDYKKGFPYLSGPKIFHYWSHIIQAYGGVQLSNTQFIEIAPDTHIIQCSVKLGVISMQESTHISREEISARWRSILQASGIHPIDMHGPLWFWSKNNFQFILE